MRRESKNENVTGTHKMHKYSTNNQERKSETENCKLQTTN